jgi:CxxC motif-containing protein (DUF1111 family)
MRVQRIARVIGVFVVGLWTTSVVTTQTGAVDAPDGYEFETNGLVSQAQFELAAAEFRGPEEADEGLGPTFNAAGCGECHSTPTLGGSSQITERRAGRFDGISFFEHPGGSLIQDRATNVRAQENVQAGHNVIALRSSLSVLGLGFVEAIDSNDIVLNQSRQALSIRGTVIEVPVLEAGGLTRVGRFGWKNQHASLISFSADAYLNEMGITSPLQPTENTINGRSAAAFDDVPDPEDATGEDVQLFADFMRATKVPPRDANLVGTFDVSLGSSLFNSIGCAGCHTRTFVTAREGTVINRGAFTVRGVLANKIIHPFSDFLLHDVGTGDGIVQNGGAGTRNQLRTPPLWGLRARTRFMHDLGSNTVNGAIQRHGGQATSSRNAYNALSSTDRNRVLKFLSSL